MKEKICFMYPGQGSQYYGMCKKLYGLDDVFTEYMNEMDHICMNLAGYSVIKYMYNDEKRYGDAFDDISFTHPAIFMVEYALTQSLIKKGIKPDYVLGCSLGEYVSFAVAGIVKVEDLMHFLLNQARGLKEECPMGRMVAVIDNINNFDRSLFNDNDVEIVSVNHDNHFIISGNIAGTDAFISEFKKKHVDYFIVPVKFGFHSKHIEYLKKNFFEYLNILNCNKGTIPVISCSRIEEVNSFDIQSLWDVIREPISFRETLLEFNSKQECIYIDIGPSGTLAGFAKNILKKKQDIYSIISPFNNEDKNIERLLSQLR